MGIKDMHAYEKAYFCMQSNSDSFMCQRQYFLSWKHSEVLGVSDKEKVSLGLT